MPLVFGGSVHCPPPLGTNTPRRDRRNLRRRSASQRWERYKREGGKCASAFEWGVAAYTGAAVCLVLSPSRDTHMNNNPKGWKKKKKKNII
jgi:hypothetical protein